MLRVRLHMQVLFLLDVLTVSGNRIDSAVLRQWPSTNRKSTVNWPREEPTAEDVTLWREALEDICPSRRCLNCLGQYVAKSHRVREWRWCAESNELLRYSQENASMDIYRNTTKKLNQYIKSATLHRVVQGDICLVDKVQPGIFRIISTAREAQEPPSWTTFVEVLHEWGCS